MVSREMPPVYTPVIVVVVVAWLVRMVVWSCTVWWHVGLAALVAGFAGAVCGPGLFPWVFVPAVAVAYAFRLWLRRRRAGTG